MRYIKKDVIVDAFRIVNVGPHKISHAISANLNKAGGDLTHSVGGTATWDCTLENGDVVALHTGNTEFAHPQVGDYYLANGQFMQKKVFEDAYEKEFYGGSYEQDEEVTS